MNQIINFLSTIPPDVWTGLFAASGLPVLIEGIKKWFSLQSPRVIMTVTATLAFATAVLPFVIATAGQNFMALGPKWVAVIGIATLAYRFVIQPLSAALSNSKAYKAALATSALDNAAVATIQPPVEVLTAPVATTPAPAILPSADAPVPVANEFVG